MSTRAFAHVPPALDVFQTLRSDVFMAYAVDVSLSEQATMPNQSPEPESVHDDASVEVYKSPLLPSISYSRPEVALLAPQNPEEFVEGSPLFAAVHVAPLFTDLNIPFHDPA